MVCEASLEGFLCLARCPSGPGRIKTVHSGLGFRV